MTLGLDFGGRGAVPRYLYFGQVYAQTQCTLQPVTLTRRKFQHLLSSAKFIYELYLLQIIYIGDIDLSQLKCEKRMVETTRIRVAVLEGQYASLEDHGVPLSVCLQLQQLGVKLQETQWTARHSLGCFSISFFWPALERNQPSKKQQKMRKSKVNKKSTVAKHFPIQCTNIQTKSPTTDAAKTELRSSTSPTVAHQPIPSEAVAAPSSPTSPKSHLPPVSTSPSCDSPQELNLLNCFDVTYENHEQGSGVNYKTREGKEERSPVVRKKRKARRCEDSESDSDESVVDVSCSRLVRYDRGA